MPAPRALLPWAALGLCLTLSILPAGAASSHGARTTGFVRREERDWSGRGRGHLSLVIEASGNAAPHLEEDGTTLLERDRERSVLAPCDAYRSEHGCNWTAEYSCPGQPNGTRGPAVDDGSLGYGCCCESQSVLLPNMTFKERELPKQTVEERVLQQLLPSPNQTVKEEAAPLKSLLSPNQTFEEKAAELARVAMALDKRGRAAVGVEAMEVLQEAKKGEVDPKNLARLEADSAYQGESAEAQERNGAAVTASDQVRLNGGVDAEELGEASSKGTSVLLGDLMAGSPEQAALFQGLRANGTVQHLGGGRPWPHGKVAYCLGPSAQPPLDPQRIVLPLIRAAAVEYANALGGCIDVRYVGHATCPDGYSSCTCEEKPAIVVHRDSSGGGCWSMLGYMGKDFQEMNLGVGCESLGTVLHELGHALGMGHEQMRKDRDSYVRVLWQNVQAGREGQFATDAGLYSASGYDYESIMHLRSDAFSKAVGLPTLQRLDGQPAELLGQRVGLSDGDIAQLVQMYKAEVPTCAGRVKSGEFGCVDGLDDNGGDVCAGITDCASHQKVKLCCACRNPNDERPAMGGIKLQCYQGADCPQPKRIGTTPDWWMASSHRRRTANWQTLSNCTVKNGQEYPISMQCKAHPGCVHTFQPGEEYSPQCNGQNNTEPCGPYVDLCDLWYPDARKSPPPPPAPAPLPLRGAARSYCQGVKAGGQGQVLAKVRGSLESCQRQCDATPGCQAFKRHFLDYECWLFDNQNATRSSLTSEESDASTYGSYYACDVETPPAPTSPPAPSLPSDGRPGDAGDGGNATHELDGDWRRRWLHLDQRWPEVPEVPGEPP